jgi:hypothetical protein
VFRIPIRADDDLRVIAAIGDVEHADDLNILACTNAPRAENARRHVVLNDRVAIALVAGAKRESRAPDRRNVVAMHEGFELVACTRGWNLFSGIALEEHREHALTILHCRI